MLIVLQTQLHIHQQPDADFLLTNPQAGYPQLLSALNGHHVQLSGHTRSGVLPYSQEEWIEDAAWIKASLDYAKDHQQPLLILQLQSGANQYYDFRQGPNFDAPEMLIGADLAAQRIADFKGDVKYIGAYDECGYLRQNEATRYNLDQVFLQHCGRLVKTVNYDQDEQEAFCSDLLSQMSSVSQLTNDSDIFVKSQAAKRFKDLFTHDDIISALNGSDKYNEKAEQLMYSSQVYPSFIISNFIKMYDEHRFFVINNEIIDGARTIGSDTPVKYDVLETYQNMRHGTDHVDQNLVDFAKKMVSEIAINNHVLSQQPYVIDVAYNDAQKPIIVEYNPFFNAGLYATNPKLLIETLL